MIVSVIGGTGPQGLGIAERLAIAGVEVIVGSRKEEKALEVVAKAKEDLADYDLNMTGMANEDAAKAGDVLILTVPLAAQKPTVEGIKEFCTDKIVMDATVPSIFFEVMMISFIRSLIISFSKIQDTSK